jgi:hypothetical protein
VVEGEGRNTSKSPLKDFPQILIRGNCLLKRKGVMNVREPNEYRRFGMEVN